VVGSTTGKAGAEKAAIEIADLQAGKAARTAAPQAGEWSITASRSGQSASMARPPASGSASSPSGFAWGSTTATTDVTAASGKPASLLHMPPQQSARAIESDAITANGRPTSFERATSPEQRADIERNTYDVTTDVKTRRMKGIEKRPGPGKDVAPGTLEGLEPTMSKEVGDPTRGSVRLEAREAAAYGAGKPSGYSLSRKVFEAVYKGRLIDTGGGLSVQAGHMVAKSTGKPGGLAIELTSLNQADKVAPRKAIEIQGAIVERKTADALLKSGQFPNLTKRMIDEAPAHSGWMHPVGMSEAEAQAKFMDDQLKVLSAPKHPLHQLTESYEEIAGHLPNRPMIPQGPPAK
jgi:hypothetical protein